MLHIQVSWKLAGSGDKGFRSFFSIYGHGGHLGHVTSILLINFHFLVPKSLHTKFGRFLRKSNFNFHM